MNINHLHLTAVDVAQMQAGHFPIAKKLIEFEGEAVAFRCLDPTGCQVEVSWHAE